MEQKRAGSPLSPAPALRPGISACTIESQSKARVWFGNAESLMCECGETDVDSTDVLKSEGQHFRAKAWPEGAVEGGSCPMVWCCQCLKTGGGQTGGGQTGNGEGAFQPLPFSSQAVGSSHPPGIHLSAVRGGGKAEGRLGRDTGVQGWHSPRPSAASGCSRWRR